MEDDPDNVDALLARSQCYMDNGQLELSLQDADSAFKKYKKVRTELHYYMYAYFLLKKKKDFF